MRKPNLPSGVSPRSAILLVTGICAVFLLFFQHREGSLLASSRSGNEGASPGAVPSSYFKKHNAKSAHVYNADVEERFEQMCGYWVDQVEVWKQNMRKHEGKIPTMKAIEKEYGTGDRIVGLITAMEHAINNGKKMQVVWKNIDAPFTMSDKLLSLLGEEFHLEEAVVRFKGAREKSPCKTKGLGLSCTEERHENCPEYYRVCISDEACKVMKRGLAEKNEKLTIAHTVGCPLRLIWSPTQELMSLPVSWYMDGNVYNGTLDEFERVMAEYRVVAVHVRLGDGHFDATAGDIGWRKKKLILDVKNCAQKVEDYMKKLQETENEANTKWLIASDDPQLRAFFRKKFPGKTVSLMHHPALLMRMDRMDKARERMELLNMFAEWYMIGRGDELITNYAHPTFGESSFSRTSWLYNLKSHFFLLRNKAHTTFCEREEFLYHGNVHLVSKSCQCVNPLNRNCPNNKL